MALSLTAKQESIFEMFSGKNQYIIPPYQRAYSWTETQCIELFEDLKRAFLENKEEGYFLGNIVIAKSMEDKNVLEVIDGQQRLTTLTLFMKVLLHSDEDSDDLKNAITIPGGRRNDVKKQRLITNVFIEKDAKFLEEALLLNLNDEICKITKKDNQFKKNLCYLFKEIESFKKDNDLQSFIDFFLYDVSLLPIQTEDSTPEKAREKALKIFETINNRGLSLSDSDIFKARLYSMALNNLKHEDFTQRWKELDEECQNIKYSINEIFRFYTQVIRAKQNIKTSEIGLREFFTQKENSPFNTMKYDKILDDLFKIIEVISFIQEVITSPKEYNELTKWFQVIGLYTNQYAINTLTVYLFSNGLKSNQKLLDFSKNLIIYLYYQGSTAKIKFTIFDLMTKIITKKENEFEYYPNKIKDDDFKYFGMLKKGFALLNLYIKPNQDAIYPYYFNKIINARDVKQLNSTWDDQDYAEYVDTMGNLLILDSSIKDVRIKAKASLLKESNIDDIKELSKQLPNWSYSNYLEREKNLQNRLISFFEKSNEN